MPHATAMASTGLQALILCGPGSSFPTFTSNPDENPKALLPIANRPMVWYPIDFCYRTGITSKTRVPNYFSFPPSSPPQPTWRLAYLLHTLIAETCFTGPSGFPTSQCSGTRFLAFSLHPAFEPES